MYTERVLKRACQSPSDSELASLFTLLNRIKRDETLTNANNGIVHRALMERLKSCWVRKTIKRRRVCIDNQYSLLAMEVYGDSFAVL